MSNALDLKLALPTGNLAAYRYAVNSVPMLSAAEEKALAERYQSTQDLDAAWRLVTSHLRFVVRIARGVSQEQIDREPSVFTKIGRAHV